MVGWEGVVRVLCCSEQSQAGKKWLLLRNQEGVDSCTVESLTDFGFGAERLNSVRYSICTKFISSCHPFKIKGKKVWLPCFGASNMQDALLPTFYFQCCTFIPKSPPLLLFCSVFHLTGPFSLPRDTPSSVAWLPFIQSLSLKLTC